jgi:NADH-quinone oxidoreductase subunit J
VAAFYLSYGLSRVQLPPGPAAPPGLGNTESIAKLLFTDYLLPFEFTSVLLLVAIVGAVVLSKSKLR